MDLLNVTGDPQSAFPGALRYWEIITSLLTGMRVFTEGSHVTIVFSDAALLVFTFAFGGFLFGAFLTWSLYRATISRLSKRNVVHLADNLVKDPALLTQVLGELPSWLSFPEYDKVSWLNEAIARLWPHLDRAIMKKLREVLEPKLEQATPIFLKKIGLAEMTLGSEPIQVTGAKYTSTQDDEVIIELKIRWNSDLEAGLIIETPLNYASNLARVPVGILGVQFYGCVRVTLKPLLPVMPGFGAITVAFMEAPYVDYELKGLGALVHLIPGVDTFLKGLVSNILKTTMVWPRRIVAPIIKGDYANLLPRPMGILELQVVSAIELCPGNLVNFSSVPGLRLIPGLSVDPFVKLWMQGYNSKHTYRTSPCYSTSNPNFTNNCFRFVVEDVSTQRVELEVWNYMEIGVGNVTGEESGTMIGHTILELKEHFDPEVYVSGETVVTALSLTSEGSALPGQKRTRKNTGKVLVKCVFHPLAVDRDSQDLTSTAIEEVAGVHPDTPEPRQMRFFFPIGNSSEPARDSSPCEVRDDEAKSALLFIKVESAQDLTPNRSLTETYERFVTIEFTRQMGEIIGQKKTKMRTTEDPIWNEEHFFIIDDFEREVESAKVTFQVYNQNIIRGDASLGSLDFSLSEIAKSKRMHSAYPLQNINQGVLRVEVSLFYWHGPVITSAGNYNLMKKERQQRENKSACT